MVQHRSEEEGAIILCIAFDKRAAAEEVKIFKRGLIGHAAVVQAVESAGTFDLIVELAITAPTSFSQFMGCFADEVSKLALRYETSFINQRHTVRPNPGDAALWVPCRDGRRRIDCSEIDRIEAESDYMRIHSGLKSWLLKATMANLSQRLDPGVFVQIHRSTIVRRNFVHQVGRSHGRWEALLQDGSRHVIPKSRIPTILRSLGPGQVDPVLPRAHMVA